MPDIRVLIADDHPVVRRGLSALLSTVEGFEVVGEATDGAEAVREAQLLRPDVVLMDVRMPDLDGVEATRRIRKAVPDTAVLMLTMYDDDATVFTAMQAGARGYLLKGAEQDDIADAIRAVVRGQAIFGPGIASRVLGYFSTPPAPAQAEDPFPELTARETRHPRAARGGQAHLGDRLRAVPLAQDGQQQPDQHLRQARGRRPAGRDHPRPRARARDVSTGLAVVLTVVSVSFGGSGAALLLRRTVPAAGALMVTTGIVGVAARSCSRPTGTPGGGSGSRPRWCWHPWR